MGNEVDLKFIEKLINYLHEINVLKFRKRRGWQEINILSDNCETIASHSFRTAIIAYHLSLMKGHDKELAVKIAFFALLHDMDEVKINDITPREYKFLKADKEKALKEALLNDEFLLKEINNYIDIIKDADNLDMILQAKEYMDLGNRYAYDWIVSGKKNLKTKEAKMLAEMIESTDSKKWILSEDDE